MSVATEIAALAAGQLFAGGVQAAEGAGGALGDRFVLPLLTGEEVVAARSSAASFLGCCGFCGGRITA